jgi:hypothetical protein
MKGLTCLLTLCCCAVSSAFGRDPEMLRERLIFCSQFVIQDPAPPIASDPNRNFGGFVHRTYDCHLMDLDEWTWTISPADTAKSIHQKKYNGVSCLTKETSNHA